MSYVLGLDCGIKSVGAAAIRIDDNEQPVAIEKIAVHLFDGGEHPKDGSSLALPRRQSRSQRRIIKRKAQRIRMLKALMAKHGIYVDCADKHYLDICPWESRHRGLQEKLSHPELSKALLHIAKRRGFKSNRKGEEPADTDGKKALTGCKNFESDFNSSMFETVGDYLYSLDQKRNISGEYNRTVKRELLQQEVSLLCERQQQFGSKSVTPEFTRAFLEIAFYQRPLASSEHMVGLCSLEKKEKRAPKKSYSAELFVLYSDLVNLRILHRTSGVERKLTPEQIALLADEAHKKIKVTYANARKILSLDPSEYFKSKRLQYKRPKEKKVLGWDELVKLCEKNSFVTMDGYHTLRKKVENLDKSLWKDLSGDPSILDEVARILSFYEDEAEIYSLLGKLGLKLNLIASISEITTFSKTINISTKAVAKLLPFMKEGFSYAESVDKAGYQFRAINENKEKFLPVFNSGELANPVVIRTLTQARKVINAFIARFGSPAYIHIELARDLAKSREDRNKISRRQRDNEEEKKIALEYAQQFFGENPSGEDRKKLRLWKQQDGFCVYSGDYIDPNTLKDRTATQIDHILPRSRSFDNSYHNQVLCLSKYNQEKADKTPFEAWGTSSRWEEIKSRASEFPTPKAQRILMENFDARSQDWKERHLNDTRYACRYLKNHIEENLILVGRKAKKVRTFNGALTSYTRHLWGFPKNRDIDDTHHGLDAVIVACLSDKVVQQVHNWSRYHSKTKGPSITKPWDSFREDLKQEMSEVFISRAPNRKAKGAAHKETINAIRSRENARIVTQKTSLAKVNLSTLEKMFDKERNWKLYELLKSRLEAHNGKPGEAFAEPVFMPTKDKLKKPNRVKGIRICIDQKQGVEIRGGLAENDRMVRVDVFQSESGFHLCPIYIDHIAKGKMPNKLIVAYKEWVDIGKEHSFLFSLFKNDLVQLIDKKGSSFLGYYQGTDVSTAAIKIMYHHSSQSTDRKGVKSMKAIKKFTVNYFGERFEVKGEKRLGLEKHLHQRKGIDKNIAEPTSHP